MLYSSVPKARVDQNFIQEFIGHYPFGLLQSVIEGRVATSGAICLYEQGTLLTHFPLINEHLRNLGTEVQLLFQGPQMYMSHEAYSKPEVMFPTWCFAWLEVTAAVEIIKDQSLVRKHLDDLFKHLQARHHYPQNKLNFDRTRALELLGQLVLLKMPIKSYDAVIKWGSDKSPIDRQAILKAFQNRTRNEVEIEFHKKLAEY